MKKLISIAALLCFSLIFTDSHAQLATQTLQTVGNATLTILKQKMDTLNQYTRILTTGGNTIGTATLALIKQKLDTANQYSRVMTTNQSIGLTSLSSIKQKLDTANQYTRVITTGQTAGTASLALIKKVADTLNQYTRLVQTNQTSGTASLTLIKKGADTLNQSLRSLLLTADTIAQVGKTKVVTFAAGSSNTGVAYLTGQAIMDNARPIQCYSVTVGGGNWEIVKIIMYPSAPNVNCNINVSVYSNTVNSGNDGTTFDPSTVFNGRYSGTFNLGSKALFTTSSIYQNFTNSIAGGIGDQTVYVTAPTAGMIYFVLWASAGFTPTNAATYNFRVFLKKLN